MEDEHEGKGREGTGPKGSEGDEGAGTKGRDRHAGDSPQRTASPLAPPQALPAAGRAAALIGRRGSPAGASPLYKGRRGRRSAHCPPPARASVARRGRLLLLLLSAEAAAELGFTPCSPPR